MIEIDSRKSNVSSNHLWYFDWESVFENESVRIESGSWDWKFYNQFFRLEIKEKSRVEILGGESQ